MLLKLDQWLANAIGKEARISHFPIKVYGGPTSKMRQSVHTEIAHEYSEKFLADADYVLFFKGKGLDGTDESLEKLAELVQRALGKASANDLTVADFKLIQGNDEAPPPEDAEGEGDADGEVEEAEEGAKSIKYAFVKITIA